MKTPEEIIDDLFSKSVTNFSKRHVLTLMREYANQFRYISTTCGKHITFDDADYPILKDCNIFWDSSRMQPMVVDTNGGPSKGGKRKIISVAALLLGAERIEQVVQYKNGDKTDLRRNNIQLITFQQAHFKQQKPKTVKGNPATSRYKGVSWSKFSNRWCASIRIGGKMKHLGQYKSEVAAAAAYNDAAIEYFGKEYAFINQITTD